MIINEKVKLGKLKINLDELAQFIVEGKRRGFAGGGKYRKMKDGSMYFSFPEFPTGKFHYEDRYWRGTQAPGYELVSWVENDQGLWFMSYCGGMLPKFQRNKKLTEKAFEFLKKMLLRVTPEKPFRGPDFDPGIGGDFMYENHVTGDIKRFGRGHEFINSKSFEDEVFSQDYHGGLIIP